MMKENSFTEKMFTAQELEEIRSKFKYVDTDINGQHRLFFDNAGGSLRLIDAENRFKKVSEMPDASEHSNRLALELLEMEDKARKEIKEVVFGAKHGAIYPSYTASQIMMEMTRIIGDHAVGTNYVTTILEHPSSFDAMTYYSAKNGCELRVAQANKVTGGVDADAVIALIDENTAVLSCMAASNISGYIYDVEKIFKRAREINPDIYIICDAVQHAPHGALDPEKLGVDVMHFAPYKFFGVRGFAVAYLSDRVATFDHHRLLGKAKDDWEIGSPATAQFAAVQAVIDYVVSLGAVKMPEETNRRKLFVKGMQRIADHERGLLYMMLEGTENMKGLRHMDHVHVEMDGKDLNTRDLIMSVSFDGVSCEAGVGEYEKHGIVTYDRSASSLYSKRMLEAFDSTGVIRLSPLHVNSLEDIEEFLKATEKIAEENSAQ